MILSIPGMFFVDLMGAGKTTVGRAVAYQLDLPFLGSDHEVEARYGMRVPVIFEHEGEVGFRSREAHMIDEPTTCNGVVIATGGDAVLRAENRAFLRERGTVIYLRTNLHGLYLRTRHGKDWPLLQTENPRVKLEELHAIRDPLYCDVTHFIIETGKPTVAQLINMVLMQLEVIGIVTPPTGSSTSSRVSPQS